MTAARSTLSMESLFARVGNALREGARWGLRGILALAIIVMAGMIAVVTAAIGLVIATVALLLRLTGARSVSMGRTKSPRTEADGITLDAHRTARGWTVE
ncbi:hypothetical protein [Henriciella aquimarina]|uniref:hypothetical protein n=1 Tax=Henriciella aquimarina TaxID=545261 RepID=UPI00117A3F54|nr:hypothetical protein [Henriciella aquimarina]